MGSRIGKRVVDSPRDYKLQSSCVASPELPDSKLDPLVTLSDRVRAHCSAGLKGAGGTIWTHPATPHVWFEQLCWHW